MPFAYYQKLKSTQKHSYEKSDEISVVRLPHMEKFKAFLPQVALALESGSLSETRIMTQKLVNGLTQVFQVPGIQIKVLTTRPSNRRGELHGLYEISADQKLPTITVWMRTAKKKQVVAFKTYLRTLLHEVLHHLDYHHFKLGESFHTKGFYQRESSLLRQFMG